MLRLLCLWYKLTIIYNTATFSDTFAQMCDLNNNRRFAIDNGNWLTPRASLKSMAAWTGSRQASDALWGIAGVPRDNLRAVGSNELLLCAPETSGLYVVDWRRNKKKFIKGEIHQCWRIDTSMWRIGSSVDSSFVIKLHVEKWTFSCRKVNISDFMLHWSIMKYFLKYSFFTRYYIFDSIKIRSKIFIDDLTLISHAEWWKEECLWKNI